MTASTPARYVKYLTSPIGLLEICAGDDALFGLDFVDHPRFFGTTNSIVEEAAAQIDTYFHSRLGRFDLPLALHGTDFQVSVWRELTRIPYGCAVSYRDIARAIGRPSAVRAVGAANGRNPIAIIVPCHRVIGVNGQLTGYASGLWRKAWLLRHEGCKTVKAETTDERERL